MTTRLQRRILHAGVTPRLRRIVAGVLIAYVATCCLLLVLHFGNG